MIEKLKNLLNIKAWIQNVAAKFIINKGVKHAAAAIVGLLGSAFFVIHVQPLLVQLGISIDPVHLAEGLTVMLTGLAGSLMNIIIRVLYHDKSEPE